MVRQLFCLGGIFQYRLRGDLRSLVRERPSASSRINALQAAACECVGCHRCSRIAALVNSSACPTATKISQMMQFHCFQRLGREDTKAASEAMPTLDIEFVLRLRRHAFRDFSKDIGDQARKAHRYRHERVHPRGVPVHLCQSEDFAE